MTGHAASASVAGERLERRVLGVHDTGRPGPTCLAQGGIHGNEPGGVTALERVLERLRTQRIDITGRLVAVAGNVRALERGERFLDRDLNRQWLPRQVDALRGQDPAIDRAEDREQRELLAIYDECAGTEPVVFVDLHSSSADGPPFSCLADTLPNRRLARSLPIPMILGLEECIDGAVMEYFNQRGQIGVAVEGGRHDAASTVENLEAAVWILLAAAGLVSPGDGAVDRHRRVLAVAAAGLPRVVEIRYRHVVAPEHGFVMRQGFRSFLPVRRGEQLAADARGPLRATESGRVLLPLYQGQGDDGYFICRDVRPFWLKVSTFLRWLRLDRLLPWFPGVRRDPDDANTLIANPKIARWLVVPVFHLFGFRRERPRDGALWFSRRWATDACEALGRRAKKVSTTFVADRAR